MENQHRRIAGYRELCKEEIDLMNEIKIKGEEISMLFDKVYVHLNAQALAARALEDKAKFEFEAERLGYAAPGNWAYEARHEMQTAHT